MCPALAGGFFTIELPEKPLPSLHLPSSWENLKLASKDSFIQIGIVCLLDLDRVLGTDTQVNKPQMTFVLMELIFLERYR